MNKEEEPKVTIVRVSPAARLAKWTAAIRGMSLDNLSNAEVPPAVRVDC